MEKKMEEMVMKKENSNSSTTTTYYDMFEGGGGCDQRETLGSLGFMDLLGVQDFGSSIFDFLQQVPPLGPPAPQPLEQSQPLVAPPQPPVKETSEVLNLPATPNSSSISSSSNEVTIDKIVEEEVQDKSKKQLKPKKKNQKRQREPRFAFMTKSDVDHLEDGYRWRKYGQKAVKNSPFPRSYYRCTNTTCGVKKRVERSCDDPTVVVTTYEGQHTHQSPVVPRSSSGGIPRDPASFGVAASGYTMPTQLAQTHYHHYQQQQQPQQQQQQQSYFHGLSPPLNFNSTTTTTATTTTSSPMFSSRASMLRDHGLLEDLVPSDFR